MGKEKIIKLETIKILENKLMAEYERMQTVAAECPACEEGVLMATAVSFDREPEGIIANYSLQCTKEDCDLVVVACHNRTEDNWRVEEIDHEGDSCAL